MGRGCLGCERGRPWRESVPQLRCSHVLLCCVPENQGDPPWIDQQTVFDRTRPLKRRHDAGRHSSSRSSSRSNLWETLPSLLTDFPSNSSWPPWTCWDPEAAGSLDLDQVGTQSVHCPSSVEGNVTSWVMRIKKSRWENVAMEALQLGCRCYHSDRYSVETDGLWT